MSERRKLCAIMFIDIVGYTSLMSTSEKQAIAAVRQVRHELKGLLPAYHGELIKALGDGYLCIFKSSIEAASCALALQQALDAAPFQIRIGLHLGDIILAGDDVYGDGVNVAARIESEASAGDIFVSDGIAQALLGHDNFQVLSQGEKRLKNVAKPIEVFRLQGQPVTAAPKPKASAVQIAVALTVLLGLVILVWLNWPPSSIAPNQEPPITTTTTSGKGDLATLAVLPFRNLSHESDSDYFSDGLSEEMILTLSRIDGLRVSARTSSFRFRDQSEDPLRIAEQLHVRYLLTGSVRRAGERMRITAELVDTQSGRAIWQESFERTLTTTAIFDVQDDIAIAVANEIPDILQLTKVTPRGTESLAAYEAFLRARDTTGSAYQDRLERLRWYEIAHELDPDFIEAEVAVSLQRGFMVGSGLLPFAETLAELQHQVDEYLERGLGQRTDVLRFAGYVAYLSGDIDGAESYYLQGLEQEPNDIGLLMSYRNILSFTTRNDLANQYFRRILELDPLNPLYVGSQAFYHMYYGDFPAMQALCHRLKDELHDPHTSYYCLKNYYAFVTFEFDKALELIHQELKHTPHSHFYFNAATLANYLHATEQAMGWAQPIEEPYYRLAMQGTTEWIQGDIDASLASLAEAYATGRQQTALTPLAQLLMSIGRYTEAIELVSTLSSLKNPQERLDRTQIQSAMVKAYSLRQLGETHESNALFERIWARLQENDLAYRGIYGIVYTRAEVLALMGERQAALDELEKLHAESIITLQHSTLFGYTPEQNLYFASLHDEPRFQQWLSGLNKQRQAMRAAAANLLDPPH
ncbi:MAG: hypothetical protein LAT77_02440 [Aliidiomarina sp.]|uniref:adenylate/guanylate cyclase domain-containing protein n=1 Tax=Aliidiomarina sp. TaxID=1872439 RepID=UPI0025C03D30|nr:adenylate/guanylate cyclase domain-containing protein [Aliidiomarina sp.]MCH8500751.1 hypothetical protein [Aliidiomarina sp.]